jgi:hypothetical protein
MLHLFGMKQQANGGALELVKMGTPANIIGIMGKNKYLPLTTAWIAATGETSTTILNALNTFEAGLIANSLTGKFNAIYPFVGGTSGKHALNFMNTLNFPLTFIGGWTHNTNGALPAVNGYAITGIIPNTHLLKDDNHLSSYIGTISNSGSDIGAFTTVPAPIRVLELDTRTGGLFRYFGNDATTLQVATTDNRGWSLGTRTGSTTKTIYKNGVSVATNSVASVGLPLVGIYLGTRNVDGVAAVPSSVARHQFDSIGSGITAGEASTLYTLIQAFQTSLSRQV